MLCEIECGVRGEFFSLKILEFFNLFDNYEVGVSGNVEKGIQKSNFREPRRPLHLKADKIPLLKLKSFLGYGLI